MNVRAIIRIVTLSFSFVCLHQYALAQQDPNAAPPIAETAVQIQKIVVNPDTQVGALRGIQYSYTFRFTAPLTEKSLSLNAAFSDAQGKNIRSKTGIHRDLQGNVAQSMPLSIGSVGEWVTLSNFIPFREFDLRPGAHKINLVFSATRHTNPNNRNSPQIPVKVTGPRSKTFSLTKPPYKTFRFLVRSVEVAHVGTDASLFRPRKALPDLQWRLAFGTAQLNAVYRSAHLDDRYSGQWTKASPPIVFSQGDTLTLYVVDHDLVSHDELGRFEFSLADLEKLGPSPAPLSQGAVLRMLIDQPRF